MMTLSDVDDYDDAYRKAGVAWRNFELMDPGSPKKRLAYHVYDIACTKLDETRARLKASGFPLGN